MLNIMIDSGRYYSVNATYRDGSWKTHIYNIICMLLLIIFSFHNKYLDRYIINYNISIKNLTKKINLPKFSIL